MLLGSGLRELDGRMDGCIHDGSCHEGDVYEGLIRIRIIVYMYMYDKKEV